MTFRISAILLSFLWAFSSALSAQNFSLADVKAYPFPNELTAAAQGSRIAWAVNEEGKRNVYVAEGPAYRARKLTAFNQDDGQEISSLRLSPDGQWVLFVRGGDHGSIWGVKEPVNPSALLFPEKVQIWAMPFAGGELKSLGDGANPVISPDSKQITFTKSGQIWAIPLDGSAPAKMLFNARGSNGAVEWSPDGKKLAFVSSRGDHSFVGVYTFGDSVISWLAPSFARDRSPRWSPNGQQIAFIRSPGSGGAPDSILVRRHQPWAIYIANVASQKVTKLWQSPKTLYGSVPRTNGGANLHWAAHNRIVFMSHQNSWPLMYSIPATGGQAVLLTPGAFMAEHVQLSPDRKFLVFSANTGPDKHDIDRRHIARVSVDKADMEVLTPGSGLEWTPFVTGDGNSIAYISATATRPPLATVMSLKKGKPQLLGQNLIPAKFPLAALVVPKPVTFQAAYGTTIHGQLFEPTKRAGRRPGLVYVHGGPSRQMLLGWNYSDYYANVYALNQYLVNQGFTVLSVNYRLGIGYGYDFHQAKKGGDEGASEYQDVKAAGEWLARQPDINPAQIGIYGGSYGGYLTAMALARDSKLFAAGVDIHGVHDLTTGSTQRVLNPDRFERAPDAELATKIAWESSPTADVKTWTSPVLIIHADDDRNVEFPQSTDLVNRLEAQGVPYETMVIVDDTHHWMSHRNALLVGQATADFFRKMFLPSSKKAEPKK